MVYKFENFNDGKSVSNDTITKDESPRILLRINCKNIKGEIMMDSWVCMVCGYVYDPEEGDPENGVEPGTAFENIPDTWLCPLCGVGKDEFEKE